MKIVIKVHTLLLAKGEVGFGVPTMLRTKSQIVGVVRSSEIDFLLGDRAKVARMPSFSTSLSCHARIHDLVGHLVWRLQVLHEKVHLGSAHIDTVDVVNALAGLLPPIFPTLVGRNVVQGWLVQAMEETLNDQPFFHAVVGACCNILLESLPSFRNSFIRSC